jgi:MFS family permease
VLADVLAPLTVGFLLAVLDWRDVMRLLVLPAGVVGLLFLRWHSTVGPSSERVAVIAGVRTLWAAWTQRAGMGMLLLMGGASIAVTALLAMMPLYLQQVHGYSLGRVGAVFAVMLLTAAVSAPLVGRASDRLGRKPMTVACLLAGGIGALVLAFGDNAVTLLFGAVLAGAALVSVRAPILAAAVELAGGHESAALGLIYAAMDGVGALGAVLAGVAGGVDLRYAMVFVAAVSGAAAFLSLIVPIKEVHGVTERRR